jgi:nucleotide-binding universal stress UspA family protein
MAIKTVLYIADDDRTAVAGLRWTRELARQQGAHVTMAWIGGAEEQAIASEVREAGAAVSVARHPTLDEEWLAGQAHHADLAVITLPRAGTAERAEDMRLSERLAQNVGCPVLILPPLVVADRVARRIAIAWNAAPPGQRAVRAALPLLAKADQIAIVTVAPDRPLDPATRLQHFLDRHGIAATVEPIIGRDAEAGTLIEQAVEQIDADLLIMGAWGRPTVEQRLFGGATRHMLGQLGIPIMISA